MIRTGIVVSAVFCTAFFVGAQTVLLSGTVKRSGTTDPIAGVDVRLTTIDSISATTDADGAFTLSGGTSVKQPPQMRTVSFQCRISGTHLVFTRVPGEGFTGRVDIFSGCGKKVSSIPLSGIRAGQKNVSLPELPPGINIIRFVINGKTFTRTLVSLDNGLFLFNEGGSDAVTPTPTARKASSAEAVDTLVASESGYITVKFPIDSYIREGMVIEMEEEKSECTRETLQAAVDSYIEAQKAGDPSKMPLAPEVKYLQNMKDITAEESIVNTALPDIASQLDIFDVDSCRSFTEIIITAGSHPYVVGIRLKVDDGAISEINTMVTDQGDWLFNAADYYKHSRDEDWGILPEDMRSDRQTLIDAGDAYFDHIHDWSGDNVPWGDDCYRIEGGGAIAKPCNVGADLNSVKTTCRTYVVDVEKSTVNIYCYFGFGPDSHLFRMENDVLRYIHTLTACNDSVPPGSDCWDKAPIGEGKGFCDW